MAQKIAEGSRIRRDRLNRDAPVPPDGPLTAPSGITAEEQMVWEQTLKLAAPGQIRPLDSGILRRYCWTMAHWILATVALEEWKKSTKDFQETDFLKLARNGELIRHPLYSVIDSLSKGLDKQEPVLGLNPVAREKIRASVQIELFPEANPFSAFNINNFSTMVQ
jgi:phage terminase small subunit